MEDHKGKFYEYLQRKFQANPEDIEKEREAYMASLERSDAMDDRASIYGLASGLQRAANQAGAIDGKVAQAETSGLDEMAKGLRARAEMGRMSADKGASDKVAERKAALEKYLTMKYGEEQDEKKLAATKAEKAEQRAYDEKKTIEGRKHQEKLAAAAQANALKIAGMRGKTTEGIAKKLSPADLERYGGGRDAINMLSELEDAISNNKDVLGPVHGRVKGANPYHLQAQTVQAQIDASKQIIGKFLEGGVLRKEDEAKYEKILPTLKDTPETAQAKINTVRALLKKKQSDNMAALSAQGYETIGLDMEIPEATASGPRPKSGQAIAAPSLKPVSEMSIEELEAELAGGRQ